MWTTDELGIARWQDDRWHWRLDARGGKHGVHFVDVAPGRKSDSSSRFALAPVNQQRLPAIGEQFVRGDQLHLTFPQGDGVFEMRLVLQAIESSPQRFVLEATVAIQTDRLDTHPKVDLEAACCRSAPNNRTDGQTAAAISSGVGDEGSISLLLGPHDRPFTTDHSSDAMLKLRLFGDFLEKGVIRKARPWIVLGRGDTRYQQAELDELLQRLSDSPLPLTA